MPEPDPTAHPAPRSLQGPLLAAVSRSFYLSLRFLPRPVRAPLSLSYLLARAADTIADVEASPAIARLSLLAAFRHQVEAIPAGRDPAFYATVSTFAAAVGHAGERELLLRLPECFAQLDQLTSTAQAKIREVLSHILDGMTLDLQRFPDNTTLRSLAGDEELDAYTWLVAGCVGEFWTAICACEIPGIFTRPEAEMTAFGGQYGKGLQLINILRDQPGDAAIGRCYLPRPSLEAAGLTGDITWPASDWTPWHHVRQDLIDRARGHLAAGWRYAASQRSIRLRFATLMPLLIGGATLTRLQALPPDQAPQAIKVTRHEVKRLACRALWMALTGRIRPD